MVAGYIRRGIPACRRSPILVLTMSGVAQLSQIASPQKQAPFQRSQRPGMDVPVQGSDGTVVERLEHLNIWPKNNGYMVLSCL